MTHNLQKRIVLNTVGAAGANRYRDTTLQQYFICTDNSLDPLVELSAPLKYGTVKSVQNRPAVVEITQHALIGEIEETVVANRFYQVMLRYTTQVKEGWSDQSKVYSQTAPVTLSGSADTDRYVLYNALVNKINADNYNNVTAYLVSRIPYDTGTAEPTYNEVLTGVGGATAKIVAWEVTTGTWGGGNAAGNIWVYDIGAIAFVAGAATGATTAALTLTAGSTAGQAMLIVDDSGYNPPRPSTRTGATEVKTTVGFDSAVVEITRSAVYNEGVGTRMLQDKPYFDVSHQNIVSGEADFVTNADPVAGTFYTTFIINIEPKATPDLVSNLSAREPYDLIIYAAQTSDTVVGANVTNLATALTNMITNS